MRKDELRKSAKLWEKAEQAVEDAARQVGYTESWWEDLPEREKSWQAYVDAARTSRYLSLEDWTKALQCVQEEIAAGRDAYLKPARDRLADAEKQLAFYRSAFADNVVYYALGKGHKVMTGTPFGEMDLDTVCVFNGETITILDLAREMLAKKKKPEVAAADRLVRYRVRWGVYSVLGENIHKALKGLKRTELVWLVCVPTSVAILRDLAALYKNRWDMRIDADAGKLMIDVAEGGVTSKIGLELGKSLSRRAYADDMIELIPAERGTDAAG